MASRYNSHFLMPRIHLQLLVMLWTLTSLYSVTECSDVIQLRGEVGGAVTFQCPVDKARTLEFVYFQTKFTDKFVNGHYETKNMTPYLWNNTRMVNQTVMIMYNLTVAHGIDYTCIFRYKGGRTEPKITLRLTVTAKYSKPKVIVRCGEEENEHGCLVTCTSHGGYPDSEVMWDAAENQRCKVLNNSKMTDPQTMLVTSSSSAYFNCTGGNVTSSRCSVGHVSSEFSVCSAKVTPVTPSGTNVVIIAVVVIVATLFITGILLYCYWRKRRGGNRGPGPVEVRTEVNGGEPGELETLRSREEV